VQCPHRRPRRERTRPPPPPSPCNRQRMQVSAPCRAPCRAGYRATWTLARGDARRVMSLVASGTGAHTFTLSHTALDGHRMAHSTGCRDVRLLPALVYCNETTPRYARTHTHLHCARRSLHASVPQCGGCRRWPQYCHDSTTTQCTDGLQLRCAAPPSRTADRFCSSSKVRCASQGFTQRVLCRSKYTMKRTPRATTDESIVAAH
jgi:hypothetical protein